MIEIKSLTKRYGSTKALDNVTFNVSKGQILGLLGPNGAGKTTTMRLICGVLFPDQGSVKINGIDIGKNPTHTKKLVGYLPETPPLYTELKVKEQIYYVGKLKGMSTNDIKKSILATLDVCGLISVENKLIANLSKGFRQRVGLAQALINDPEVLILDEPTVGLDPKQIIEIRELVKSMSQKRTVVFSSHILSEVQAICSDIVILNYGKIIASGNSKSFVTRLQERHAYELTASVCDDKLKNIINGIEDVQTCYMKKEDNVLVIETKNKIDIRNKISNSVFQNGYELLELKEIHPSLEDIFINLVEDKKQR